MLFVHDAGQISGMEGVVRKGVDGTKKGPHEGASPLWKRILHLDIAVALLIYRCDKMSEDYSSNVLRNTAHAHTGEI